MWKGEEGRGKLKTGGGVVHKGQSGPAAEGQLPRARMPAVKVQLRKAWMPARPCPAHFRQLTTAPLPAQPARLGYQPRRSTKPINQADQQ